ncbi:YbfB/YjiJ family MFS transporter [Nocardia sp. NPDC051570]|uniref:YbfB/YjiJ family MFS transporter n=1 Tax=Nocardia sp. NPDC051570 TaxID=3364324 RepID=UPI0037BD08E3
MTITLPRQHTLAPAVRASAGLAAAMGIGRFAYTPLLPVMIGAGRIGAQAGAIIAAANYAGYLIGAIALARHPEWNGRIAFRVAAGALVLSEALMAWPAPTVVPAVLRLIAGVASAVVFIGCASIAARHENRRRAAGITFAGVGCGIAATGALALVFGPLVSWQALWLGAAALTAVLLLPALRLEIVPGTRARADATRSVWPWRALLLTYFLEGLGYIVIGTFLVAAARHATLGTTLWVIVGVAAAPATVLWGVVARRRTPVRAIAIALALQFFAALLPALSPSTVPSLISAALFGATFMGITMLAIEIGDDLAGAGAAATLTAVYGLGQVLGPLVVTPVLGTSYTAAFAIAAVVLAAATGAALLIRTRT